MKGRMKRIIAMLSVAIMLVGQCSSVLAEEVTDSTEVVEASEIGIEEEGVEVESETATVVESETEAETTTEEATEVATVVESEVVTEVAEEDLAAVPMLLAEEEESTLLAPTNVKWTAGYTGITFDNPNTEDVWLVAALYTGDSLQTRTSYHTSYGYEWEVDTYFSSYITTATDYHITLYVCDGDLTWDEVWNTFQNSEYKASTEVFTYTCPEKIATPTGITFYDTGLVVWDAVADASGYYVYLYDITDGTQTEVSRYTATDCACNVSYNIEEGKTYAVAVQTLSADMTKYSSSDQSDLVEMVELEDTEIKLATDLRWSDETPGVAVFYNPNLTQVKVVAYLLQDGRQLTSWWSSSTMPGTMSFEFNQNINESGEYAFVVKFFPYGEEGDYDLTTGYVSEQSEVYTYVRPDNVLSAPSNIKWSETDAGIVSWDAVDGAYSYMSMLIDVTDGAENWIIGYGSRATKENFLSKIAEGKSYAVKVKAYSENIEKYANSEYSEIVYMDGTTITDKVNETLSEQVDNLSSASTADEVKAAANNVKDAYADSLSNLQYAMQTNDETQAQIEKLEGLYEEAMGVSSKTEIAEDTGIDASKVSLLGASLNATQAGEVSFNMSKPDEETQKSLITHSRFNNAVCFSMDLEGAGVTPGALEVPVTVTMPCPEGIDINKLCIIHYAADGSSELLDVRQNADGTISFTVTHFSEFVFGETTTTPSGDSNGDSGAGSSGSTATATKAWTPTTADEIERHSFLGHDKVSYIVGTEGGYKAELVNMMQGRLFFDAVDTVKGDYSVARTYNVKIDGKLVQETEAPAMFILDIPEEYLAEGREYKMICVTKDGEAIVLDDLDAVAETITFLTNKFYAFALVYKDAAITE